MGIGVNMDRNEIQKKYDDNHTIRISLKLNLKTDKDIIDKIDMNSKQASIKELIRKGIKSST